MSYTNRGFITVTVLLTAAAPLLAPVGLRAQAPSTPAKAAQSTSSAPAEKGERWLHVRANCTDGKGGDGSRKRAARNGGKGAPRG